jgi:hypothetical protein
VKVPSFESIKFQVYFCRDRFISKEIKTPSLFFLRKAQSSIGYSHFYHPSKLVMIALLFHMASQKILSVGICRYAV